MNSSCIGKCWNCKSESLVEILPEGRAKCFDCGFTHVMSKRIYFNLKDKKRDKEVYLQYGEYCPYCNSEEMIYTTNGFKCNFCEIETIFNDNINVVIEI